MYKTVSKHSINSGFTLVEVIMVVGLLAMAVGLTTSMVLSITKSFSKTDASNDIERQANALVSSLESEIQDSHYVELVDNATGPDFLRIKRYTTEQPNGSNDNITRDSLAKLELTILYSLTSNTLYRKVENIAIINDTPDSYPVNLVPFNKDIALPLHSIKIEDGGVFVRCSDTNPDCFSIVSSPTPTIVKLGFVFYSPVTASNFFEEVPIDTTVIAKGTY